MTNPTEPVLTEETVNNRNIEAAMDYHESTKLTYINLRNKPPLYKSYQGGKVVDLPTSFSQPTVSTLEAVAGIGAPSLEDPGGLDLPAVAQLLFYSAGLITKRVLPVAGEVHYRAAASAGALYPVEVYLVSGDIPGLAAGVYHFSPADFTLRQLREGDYRGELVGATAGDEAISVAPVTMVFTAIFWRSAWKYRARGYRYCFWDAGTMLANLLATARGEARLTTRLVTGFVDHRVDRLLGVQSEREASLCLVALGTGSGVPAGYAPTEVAPLDAQTGDGFPGEISYPEISNTHAAACLNEEDEVSAWRGNGDGQGSPVSLAPTRALAEDMASERSIQTLQAGPLGQTILARGSTRRFAREPISVGQLEAILDSSTGKLPADIADDEPESPLVDAYIIANAVEGLSAGAYYYSPLVRKLELLKQGAFREEAGHLCFEQALGADSAAVVFFMAELDRVLKRYGNRGYRAAQLQAGIMVGNAYLCAHSLELGATGMTFYDDDVVEFFSPHAAGKSLMFLVAVGEIDAKNRVRPFRSRVGVLLDSMARGAGGPAPTEGTR